MVSRRRPDKRGLGEGAAAALRRRPSPAEMPRAGGFVAELARQRIEVVNVPLDARLADNPLNPRGTLDDLEGLAGSIREYGLIQPIVVTPADTFRRAHPQVALPGGAEWVLRAGHRRRAAAVMAGLDSLPGIVRADDGGTVATLEVALVENVLRADLPPIDEARALATLMDGLGVESQRELARKTGIPQARISRRLSLLELPAEVQDAIDAGQVPMQDVPDLAKLAPDRQVEAVRRADRDRTPLAVVVRQLERSPAVPADRDPFAPPDTPTAPVLHLPARGPAADPSESHRPSRPKVPAPQETAEDAARTDAAQARAAACRQLVGSTLKTTDTLVLLQDAALLPVHDTSPQAIRVAADWCGAEVVGDPIEWVARPHARRFRLKLALAVYLAHREADIAKLGDRPWGAAARLHVARLVTLGVHELTDYERGQGVTVGDQEEGE
jgi:ParB/RepB/Spo0J family partition protein